MQRHHCKVSASNTPHLPLLFANPGHSLTHLWLPASMYMTTGDYILLHSEHWPPYQSQISTAPPLISPLKPALQYPKSKWIRQVVGNDAMITGCHPSFHNTSFCISNTQIRFSFSVVSIISQEWTVVKPPLKSLNRK